MEFLKQAGSFLLDLLFPVECLGCRRPGVSFCSGCVTAVRLFPELCPFCERRSRFGATCRECRTQHSLDGLLVGAASFTPTLQRAVHAFKYRGVRSLAAPLSEIVTGVVRDEPILRQFLAAPSFTLVPIPLHRRRLRERGYNQSESLTQEYRRQLQLAAAPALVRIRDVLPQVELRRARRLENVLGAFKAARVAQIPKRCMLIDDLATTGATLDEAARTLKEAGARTVWGMVIARG